VVDVAVLALLLGAEVLADAEDGQVDEVAPLDRGGDLHHLLAVGQGVPVVVGHRRQADLGDHPAVEEQLEAAVVVRPDPVRRVGVGPHRHHRAAQVVGPAGEHDLLRRAAQRGLAQLRKGAVIEREDEVRLRLDVALLVVGQRRVVERQATTQQILLDHRFPRNVREPAHQVLDEVGA
jgi:hypothetical protein